MMTENKSSEQGKEIIINPNKLKCLICNRELRSSCEYIGNQNDVLCEDCYQELAFPHLKDSIKKKLY